MTTTEPVWALVDEMRMEQVVSNLIDNAVKFSPTGGRIDVGVSPGDAHTVILTVRDRGVGVAEEHRGRLFEQFYQAHPNLRSGMGLGLYIVHGIVTAHGGQIRAEFPADGGSTFIVELPADGRTLPTSPTADAVRFS
jgi:signal transduction histidine kinase